jgi:hypothetical protein
MVGIPSFGNADTIGYVVRAAMAGMVQYFPDLTPVLVNADGGSVDDTPRVAVSTESPEYIEKMILVRPRHRLRRMAVTYRGTSGKGTAVRARSPGRSTAGGSASRSAASSPSAATSSTPCSSSVTGMRRPRSSGSTSG